MDEEKYNPENTLMYMLALRRERAEWKDKEKVNEESDARGFLSLAPDIRTHTHTHTLLNTTLKPQ